MFKDLLKPFQHKNRLLSALLALTAAGASCGLLAPAQMQWQDIAPLGEHLEDLRLKNYDAMQKRIAQKEEPLYTELYLSALIYQAASNPKEAARYYAAAAFLNPGSLPEKYYPSVVIPYLKSFSRPSPFYEEAILNIAKIFLQTHGPDYSLQALRLLPQHPTQVSGPAVTDLRVQVIADVDRSVAIQTYKSLNEVDPQPLYYLKLGGLASLNGDAQEALNNYSSVLQLTTSGWTYDTAVIKIIELYEKNPKLQLQPSQQIYIAESYRREKKYPQSLSIWKSLDPQGFTQDELAFYLLHYAKLLAEARQPHALVELIANHKSRLTPQAYAALLDALGPLLYDKTYYRELIALTQGDLPNRQATLYRLRALEKVGGENVEDEAAAYLRNHDSASVYVETVFFKVCFAYLQQQKIQQAQQCLAKLRKETIDQQNGGRARFYLARTYEGQGETEEAIQMYREVYLNSPAHHYAFNALNRAAQLAQQIGETPPPNLTLNQKMDWQQARLWITHNYSRPQELTKLHQLRADNPNFGIDPYWIEWKQKMKDMEENGSNAEKKGAYFYLIEYSHTAQQYPIDSTEKKTLAYMTAARQANDAHINYQSLRWYMALTNKQPDILAMPEEAIKALFPVPYLKEVREAGDRYQIDEAHVYAFMKQESAFHPGLTSRSGAMGLMQIMPATATWLNETMKIANLDPYNPQHNISMAANFYEFLYKMNDGILEKIAIAYNAGPGRLAQWSKRYEERDLEYFLEQIPIYETYAYVQKTRAYYDRYKIVLDLYYPPQAN